MSRTNVAIVGAGPAGLVMGHVLHRAGVPFVIVERHPRDDHQTTPKAGLIEYRTVQLLTEAGIAGAVLDFGIENHRCEFRTPRERIVLDYGVLTGGRPHFIYPQHELVAKLTDALVETGADVRFGAEVVEVRQTADAASLVARGADGKTVGLEADVVVGCDGPRGPVISALDGIRVVEEIYPVRWLGLIGDAPPIEPHTIYAAHPRGFAGQMRRGPSLTRYFLEVSATDQLAQWPEQRARDELSLRLGEPDRLQAVPLIEPGFVDLRVRMAEPMQQGRVFLAGDAAHLITPAGGKGMNLAIQDAVELANGLAERFGSRQDDRRLRAYSDTRLPSIWRAQAFSNWMLRLILAGFHGAGGVPDPGGFGARLRDGWVSSLQEDDRLARWFAHAYAGVDQEATISSEPAALV